MDEEEIKELSEIYSRKYLPYKEVNGDYMYTLEEFESFIKSLGMIKKKPIIGKHLEGLPVRITDFYSYQYRLKTNIGIIKRVVKPNLIDVLVVRRDERKTILAFHPNDLEILFGGI